MSSSNRSSNVPLSFDRFRVRSIEFRVPFRDHQREKCIKQSPDRSWTRKTQVHPHDINLSKSKRIDHDVVHLFHANKQSNPMTSSSSSSLLENLQNKNINPPTPYMLHYRHSSVPTRIIKRPKYFDESNKQSDLHLIDQPDA
ncbi:unnamed protein product [Rotaria sordida]|uniref:Uncharacterized protein n=1 Tax=Rotaria sordida TaxID=392033 RepID=A0A813U0C9_9BILA|nr:unnamed protein product [Rotaria sordida]